MLWPREEFHAAYGQIKHDALQSGSSCSVLILVALDVDALCAAEILTRLLRADMLSYSLLAVRGYEDVLQARETRIRGADGTLRGGGELRSVIMLNCGAIVDVAKLLALPTHVKCYVLDSHRPIHLANIYDEHQQIVVFDDGALALDEYPAFGPDLEDEVLAIDAPTPSSGPGANGDEDRHPGYDDGKISFEEEYRFMCYRHWSLYEAMYYSDYVASKLGLYHDQARRVGARNASGNSGNGAGDTALHVFLARMGFSLRQSQQKFSYMPLEMKQMLREKTQEMAPEFGLDDLFYGSFKRTFAFQYQLCAADAVYGLQALLEAPENYVAAVFEAETQHQNNTLTSLFSLDSILSSSTNSNENDKDGDDKDAEAGEDSQDDFRQQNFMLAHTALACQSVTSSKLMESGIKVAMSLKQAIVRVGLSIMERKLLVRVKHFRYVCLNVPEREQELFANANVLTQLALFLLNVHRASGKWGGPNAPTRKKPQEDGENEDGDAEEETVTNKSIVPLMLITRNPAQNCFLVVGLTCPSTPGEIHRNTLGTAFKLAAGETGANFRQDGFTSAVMEIQIDEIQYFVEQLHNVLDA
ncbi:Cell division control protein 45 [Phytophthora nicotianae]|uniref:Cell division control protein 45 n=1 Tax=Phytophthora nicotianae TaxID=4792 RepID=A0A0W8C8N4_PHYNI|nr:Cell division control protein 45 [Phytophthora nicotianae]